MTADASGTEPGGEAEEDHSRASHLNKRDASASDLSTEPGSDAASAGASAMPDFARHLHPVAERVRGASEKLAATFNERVVPSTSRSLDDAKHGWRTRVAPSIESGGAAVASFFGAVTDAARQTNDKLKRSNSREAFKSFGEMGDGLSRRAATAMDTIKEGTRELRFGVARPDDPRPAHRRRRRRRRVAAGGARSGSARRPYATATRERHERQTPRTPRKRLRLRSEKVKKANARSLLRRTETALCSASRSTRAASDARVRADAVRRRGDVLWLGASRAFETPDALTIERGDTTRDHESASVDSVSTSSDDTNDEDDEASRLLESFRTNPARLIGPDVAPRHVLAALWRYLESLPEPPVAFSLYAALAREFPADTPGREKSDAAEALAGLLPPARGERRAECVLGLAALVVAGQSRRGDDASEAAAARRVARAVAPRVAWPRAGAVVKGDDKAGVRPLDGPRPLESLRPRGARGARRRRVRRAAHSAARRRRGDRRGDRERGNAPRRSKTRNRRIEESQLSPRDYSSLFVNVSFRTEPAETSELQRKEPRSGVRSRAEKRRFQPRWARFVLHLLELLVRHVLAELLRDALEVLERDLAGLVVVEELGTPSGSPRASPSRPSCPSSSRGTPQKSMVPEAVLVDVGDHLLDLLLLRLEAERAHRHLQLLGVDGARAVRVEEVERLADLLLACGNACVCD